MGKILLPLKPQTRESDRVCRQQNIA